MNISGLIIWHYYLDGKLTNSSAVRFKGTFEELEKETKEKSEPNAKNFEEGKKICIFHTFILINYGE